MSYPSGLRYSRNMSRDLDDVLSRFAAGGELRRSSHEDDMMTLERIVRADQEDAAGSTARPNTLYFYPREDARFPYADDPALLLQTICLTEAETERALFEIVGLGELARAGDVGILRCVDLAYLGDQTFVVERWVEESGEEFEMGDEGPPALYFAGCDVVGGALLILWRDELAGLTELLGLEAEIDFEPCGELVVDGS